MASSAGTGWRWRRTCGCRPWRWASGTGPSTAGTGAGRVRRAGPRRPPRRRQPPLPQRRRWRRRRRPRRAPTRAGRQPAGRRLRSWAEPMDTEGDVVNGATRGQPVLYTVVAAGGFRGVPSPLAEAPIGPGHWAYANRPGPALYAVPRPGDGYEWAPWEEACRRGWSGRSGRCEYWGPELARRFIVLYVPAGRRAWWQRWRPSRPRPVRLGRFGSEGEARLRAEQVLPR